LNETQEQVTFVEREMTQIEFARMNEGFNEEDIRHGNSIQTQERFGFVALMQGEFIGCSSCLVHKQAGGFSSWCFLTDLFVHIAYRKKGVGAELLKRIENRMREIRVEYIYTWTASYEAPEFYKKQGYQVFVEFENWYQSGHSRVGLQKKL
jgi:N-acetylglutamate synthase-like GNAT family acetyltransferase